MLGTDGVFCARRAGNEPASTPDTVSPALPTMLVNPTGSLKQRPESRYVVRLLSYRRLTNFPLIVTAAQARRSACGVRGVATAYLGLATVASAILVFAGYAVSCAQRSQRRTWEARQISSRRIGQQPGRVLLMRSVRDEAGRSSISSSAT